MKALRFGFLGRCWLLLGWLSWGLAGRGQAQRFEFENPRTRRITVPVEVQRNLLVLALRLNGKGPYNFLLDTGVVPSIITDPALRQELSLRVGKEFMVAGAGSESALEAFRTDGVRVELPGIVHPSCAFLVLTEDVLDLSGYVGMPIHGIIGADLFYSFVVTVRPSQSQVTFHRPATYKAPRSRRWSRVPLALEANKAYLTTSVALTDSLTVPLKLVVDTGAGHALSLETTSDARLQVPPQRLRTQLGRGLNGFINGYLGRVSGIQLGRHRLRIPITSFPDASNVAQRVTVPRNGNLGMEILKRFDMVINYPGEYLLLRPNAQFSEPFEHDMCGFELIATGPDYRRYLLAKVEPNSPADEAGLRDQDEIIGINQLPAAVFNLTQVSRIFHSSDGRVILLIVRRPDGDLFTTMIRLKRQI